MCRNYLISFFKTENALPICLPVTNAMLNRDIRGLNGSVAGWGITEHGFTSSKLLTVNVPVLTQQSCSALYNRYVDLGT